MMVHDFESTCILSLRQSYKFFVDIRKFKMHLSRMWFYLSLVKYSCVILFKSYFADTNRFSWIEHIATKRISYLLLKIFIFTASFGSDC